VRLTKLLAASSLFQALGGGWTPDGKLATAQVPDQAPEGTPQ
jgi:multidrug efflux system outer membrane protein